jgi:hypothetical protein
MRSTTNLTWQQPNPRGKFLGLLGVVVVFGLLVVVGLLMSAVAQTQTVRDEREGTTPLDVRSVTFRHDGENLVVKIRMWRRTPLRQLSGGSRLWVSIQPGGDRYYLVEMSKSPKGPVTTLTRCDADRCAYEESVVVAGKQVGKRGFKMTVPRNLIQGLGDRLEWQGGSVYGSNRFDQAPDKGPKVHHL